MEATTAQYCLLLTRLSLGIWPTILVTVQSQARRRKPKGPWGDCGNPTSSPTSSERGTVGVLPIALSAADVCISRSNMRRRRRGGEREQEEQEVRRERTHLKWPSWFPRDLGHLAALQHRRRRRPPFGLSSTSFSPATSPLCETHRAHLTCRAFTKPRSSRVPNLKGAKWL